MEIKKVPNVLILSGIKLDDVTYIKKAPRIPVKNYTEIPDVFTDVNSWPKRSNLKCWECGLVPDAYPKFIPMYPQCRDGIDICDAYGHFCEWSCAARHIQTGDFKNRIDMMEILLLFEEKFSENRKKVIIMSPPKTIMQDYCGAGGCTVEEYKRKLRFNS